MTEPQNQLRLFKKRHGLTNGELGEMLGLPVYMGRTGPICPQLSRWLCGRNKPPAMLDLALQELERRKREPQNENPAD